jgi:protein-histidine pros-kinase
MRLIVKFNLVLLLVFAIGFGATGYLSHNLLQRHAREEIVQNARIMMEAALAVRNYTNKQIKPLLANQMQYEFLAESVPAFAAHETFGTLQSRFADYAYKEATLNPTNPRDRATDWESDLVNAFRQDPQMGELIGVRDTPQGPSLYLARPIQIKDPGCLTCHSTVSAAPKTMIDKYGTANGFGWNLNEVVGTQVVSVPMALPISRADKAFKVFMASLGGVFVFIFVSMNVLLVALVTRPVKRLAAIADEVSLGNMNAPEFETRGSDEIAVLAQSFGRVRKSLVQAFKLLEG